MPPITGTASSSQNQTTDVQGYDLSVSLVASDRLQVVQEDVRTVTLPEDVRSSTVSP